MYRNICDVLRSHHTVLFHKIWHSVTEHVQSQSWLNDKLANIIGDKHNIMFICAKLIFATLLKLLYHDFLASLTPGV